MKKPFSLLCINYKLTPEISDHLSDIDTYRIDNPQTELEALRLQKSPACILIGSSKNHQATLSHVQCIKNKYDKSKIFVVVNSEDQIDTLEIKNNGAEEVFALPFDNDLFKSEILSSFSIQVPSGNTDEDDNEYLSVKISDFMPGSQLAFDTYVYMPKNKKFICVNRENDLVTKEKLAKYYQNNLSSLYIKKQDLPKFLTYTAKLLKDINGNPTLSQTEKIARVKKSVRNIVMHLFSDVTVGKSGGGDLVKACQKIVHEYIKAGPHGQVYEQILGKRIEGGGLYAHLPNVSSVACIIAMSLGFPTVDEIALAGLLHDIGHAKLPKHVVETSYDKLVPGDKMIFQNHVRLSVKMMKKQRLLLPELVYKIVEQHHERYNGTGYPEQISGSKICKEAQILAFADIFDEMTNDHDSQHSIADVTQYFIRTMAEKNAFLIEPSLLRQILRLMAVAEAKEAA